eukprot:2643842-Prymnesium_polylepis.1
MFAFCSKRKPPALGLRLLTYRARLRREPFRVVGEPLRRVRQAPQLLAALRERISRVRRGAGGTRGVRDRRGARALRAAAGAPRATDDEECELVD